MGGEAARKSSSPSPRQRIGEERRLNRHAAGAGIGRGEPKQDSHGWLPIMYIIGVLSERTAWPLHDKEHDQPVPADIEPHEREYAILFPLSDMLTMRHKAGEFFFVSSFIATASTKTRCPTSIWSTPSLFSTRWSATSHVHQGIATIEKRRNMAAECSSPILNAWFASVLRSRSSRVPQALACG